MTSCPLIESTAGVSTYAVHLRTGISSTLSTGTSSVSAAVKWDTRKLAAQSRMRRCRSNHRVGTCSQMDSNSESLIRHRETPFRPGSHPNRSECHSSGPRFIFIKLTHLNRHHTQTFLNQLHLTLRIQSASWLYGLGIMTLRDRLVPR